MRARADAGIDSGADEEDGTAEPNAGLGDGDGGAFWEGLGGRAGLAPSFSGVPPPGPGGEFESELAKREAELALREEIILVREFQRDLAFNLRKARARPWHPHALAPSPPARPGVQPAQGIPISSAIRAGREASPPTVSKANHLRSALSVHVCFK